jgi:hypothetical protein
MVRRLYLTFPTSSQARRAVADLEGAGVLPAHMHAVAKPGTDLSDLPRATEGQKHDQVWRLERLFWYGNLGVFALAALGLIAALVAWSPVGMIASVVVLVATFIAGERFAIKLPHAHLADLRVPLEHGEVVLLVDVPLQRVREIEHLVAERHPEIGVGGVGWTIEAFGV